MPSASRVAASLRPRVSFKGPVRWGSDLARALALPVDELCFELSQYDCLETHAIALGGVEPYTLGIDAPLPVLPVTAAIAADRVALEACRQRADLDLGAVAEPVLFTELRAGAPTRASLEAVSARLYRRVLSREGRPEELSELADFYEEVVAEATLHPERDWAVTACFALASSLESLFY
ncbi:MAG: hypothetical protein AAFZ18_14095 [Myxococcota bacterium]